MNVCTPYNPAVGRAIKLVKRYIDTNISFGNTVQINNGGGAAPHPYIHMQYTLKIYEIFKTKKLD